MAANLEPLPGTSDIWEPEISEWLDLESKARTVFGLYGYDELRTPMFERTDVFVHGIGDQTEVVQKEMYTFEDRGGRSLTLRPEGTAGVMRAIAAHGLGTGEEKRVHYLGPMFRGERPAAGRRRQFHQIGVEAVGSLASMADVECIAMLMHFLEAIDIPDASLLVNTRGTPGEREQVSAAFRQHFTPRVDAMCQDCRRRLDTNIWRILDCKEDACQDAINAAPSMVDLVGPESRSFFGQVCAGLDALKIDYTVAPRLVRGLDYYVHTVFEVTHGGLGAQDALAGGGRYSVHLRGLKSPMEGVGFAAGIERLLLARQSLGVRAATPAGIDVYVASIGEESLARGLLLAQMLRRQGVRVLAERQAGRSMKAQMRSANRLGVRFALIQGEAEIERGTVICRNMHASDQEELAWTSLPTALVDRLRTDSTGA